MVNELEETRLGQAFGREFQGVYLMLCFAASLEMVLVHDLGFYEKFDTKSVLHL